MEFANQSFLPLSFPPSWATVCFEVPKRCLGGAQLSEFGWESLTDPIQMTAGAFGHYNINVNLDYILDKNVEESGVWPLILLLLLMLLVGWAG